MKILFPNNVFSSLLIEMLPKELAGQVSFAESARLFNELENDGCDAALIPTLDILKNKDMFVSRKMCIAFYSFMGNSFLYFVPEQQELNTISVTGDMSSHDIIVAKYLFSEMYNKEIEISLFSGKKDKAEENNLLVVGDSNFEEMKMLNALSISEEVNEMISFPYVNYILASKSGAALSEINSAINDLNVNLDEEIERITGLLADIPQPVKEYLIDNSGSLSFNLGETEEHGVTELLRLPYFKGMIDDIIDVKFV